MEVVENVSLICEFPFILVIITSSNFVLVRIFINLLCFLEEETQLVFVVVVTMVTTTHVTILTSAGGLLMFAQVRYKKHHNYSNLLNNNIAENHNSTASDNSTCYLDELAECANTDGSYECICPDGFYYDSDTCINKTVVEVSETDFIGDIVLSYEVKLIKMRAKLVNLNHCAVPFLSRAAANLCWFYYYVVYYIYTRVGKNKQS